MTPKSEFLQISFNKRSILKCNTTKCTVPISVILSYYFLLTSLSKRTAGSWGNQRLSHSD